MLRTSGLQASSWPLPHRVARATLAAAGSVTFAVLLLSLAHVDGVPVLLLAALAGLAAGSAWRPAAALLLLAAAIPVAAWTGRTWHGGIAWPETLAVAFAAGYLARPVWSRPRATDGLHLPVAVFTALVLASLAVRLLVLHWTIGGEALWLQIRELALGRYVIGNGGFRELDAAMRLIEGMVLLRAAATASAESPVFAPRLIRWFSAGAAAAAALNLWRIWQGAMRSDTPVAAFLDYLMTLRYNVHYGDVNAAGSYFVMALLVAVGLALATRRARWMAAAVLIASSLMLSGSRTALAAGGVAAVMWVMPFTLRGQREHRTGRFASAVPLLLIAALVAAAFLAIAGRSVAASTALRIRVEFARITANMVAAHPAFGVGIGRYPDGAGELAPAPVAFFRLAGENAHNNFLQVLGELGLTGLAGFLWVLGAAAAGHARNDSALQRGARMGLVAFVLTWVAGHPLLIDEPALLFWLLLGTGAVVRDARGLPSWTAVAAAAAIAAIAVSVPLRARTRLAEANLEHQGIGLSAWRHGADGVRYRLAGASSTVFVPADARRIVLPLRGAVPAVELEVALELNGRPADVVRVAPDAWRQVALYLPDTPAGPRFHRLDLRVTGSPPSSEPMLMIGKVEPH